MNSPNDPDRLIERYAKKIYGFAYSKTQNVHDAEDLSQNILLTLCGIDFSRKQIGNMDSYIYRICEYTWSNFVRKNKPYWEGVPYSDELLTGQTKSPEDELLESELYRRLRREIAYLSETRRKIVILFYYENRSGAEIADRLSIPAATVRWHLGESKKRLKERLNMQESVYTPKQLKVFFSGNANDFSLAGLRDDLLVQNICIACGEKPRTVEEIAQILCVHAAFIENRIGALLHMHYLEKTPAGKYFTTFLVQDADFFLAKKRFEWERLPAIADAIYASVCKHLPAVRAIGFSGSDLNDNFLLWLFVTSAAHEYVGRNYIPLEYKMPIRGDGSAHWIDARWEDKEIFDAYPSLEPALADYISYSGGQAGKHSGSNGLTSVQFDPPVVTGGRGHWTHVELDAIRFIHALSSSDQRLNDFEKEAIARLVAQGYAAVQDGKPTLLIPYFTAKEYASYRDILDNRILADVESAVGASVNADYAAYIRGVIPSHLPEEEKAFQASRFYQPNAYSYLLYKAGKLAMPTSDEAKRICTMVWEWE